MKIPFEWVEIIFFKSQFGPKNNLYEKNNYNEMGGECDWENMFFFLFVCF